MPGRRLAGCHADVGGGSHGTDEKDSLSSITLRWMIKECFAAKTGILFNEHLQDIGLKYDPLSDNVYTDNNPINLRDIPKDVAVNHRSAFFAVLEMLETYLPGIDLTLESKEDSCDAVAPLYNQLELAPFWWILELLPLLGTYQQEDGTWLRQRRRNFGNGRYMPHSDHEIKVHVSVLERIRSKKDPYTPSAYNWNAALKGGLVKWVD